VVNIVNQGTLGGGFRHYSGLLPTVPGDGASQSQASVRIFHIPAANAAAIFRGDIACSASAAIGVQGAADLPANIAAPSATSAVIGNGGGSGLGNPSMAGNMTRWVAGDTTSVILGCVVGWGPLTLYQAKNGFQYCPALTEAWAFVETDPAMEFNITMPTVPAIAFPNDLQSGIDVQANAAQQSTRFGISGVSLNPATIALTATLPLRLLNSGDQIGNDTTAVGFIARVQFNLARHFKGGAGFVAQ
jgi:hypothetical protein